MELEGGASAPGGNRPKTVSSKVWGNCQGCKKVGGIHPVAIRSNTAKQKLSFPGVR